jgi:hypothetical protein
MDYPEWKQFERLVARIEATLAPKGAVVRSPDRIPDLITGSLREVDGSIRLNVGSASILITLESRRRGAVQDDTWIEQLATKKEKIGAAKTIAVSSSGFSEPAKITARTKGIELRNLREITDEEILGWLPSSVLLTKVGLHLTLKKISAELENSQQEYIFQPDESGSIRALIRVYDGKFVSPYDVLNLLVRTNTLTNVPLDGTKVGYLVTAHLPKGALQVQSDNGSELITSISFELQCWHKVSTSSLPEGNYYEYSDPDGVILQRAEFQADLEGRPFLLGVQITPIEEHMPERKPKLKPKPKPKRKR